MQGVTLKGGYPPWRGIKLNPPGRVTILSSFSAHNIIWLPGLNRTNRDNRDDRANRDNRDNRDNADSRDNRDSKDYRDNRDNRANRSNRDKTKTITNFEIRKSIENLRIPK